MLHDIHGLPVSSSSPDAVAAFDRTTLSYLKYRLDTPEHLARALATDPEFGLAYCVAVDLMRPVLAEMALLGGSHAHQDVLERLIARRSVAPESKPSRRQRRTPGG
jgi:hypothetical protein